VVIHRPPARLPKRNDRLWFHRRDRWRRVAIAQAAVAADDRAVTVIGGANAIRQLPEARLVDEMRIDVMPVMLGAGALSTGSIRSWSRSRGSASRRSASGRA